MLGWRCWGEGAVVPGRRCWGCGDGSNGEAVVHASAVAMASWYQGGGAGTVVLAWWYRGESRYLLKQPHTPKEGTSANKRNQ